MPKALTLTLDGQHVDDIRRMTGGEDDEWIKMAFAVYWQLLAENPDSVVRFIRENGQIASMGLTREADSILRGDNSQID